MHAGALGRGQEIDTSPCRWTRSGERPWSTNVFVEKLRAIWIFFAKMLVVSDILRTFATESYEHGKTETIMVMNRREITHHAQYEHVTTRPGACHNRPAAAPPNYPPHNQIVTNYSLIYCQPILAFTMSSLALKSKERLFFLPYNSSTDGSTY